MGKLNDMLSDEAKKKFAESLLNKFDELGLSVLSKADFEAYLFYLIESLSNNADVSNFDWQDILKVTPAKLKSLQVNASVKFKSLDLEDKVSWILVAKKLIKSKWEIESVEKGTVKLFIDDFHLARFLEKYANSLGSTPDKTLNATQFVVKYEVFLSILEEISVQTQISTKRLYDELVKDKSIKALADEIHPTKQIFKDIKGILTNDSHKIMVQELLKLTTRVLFDLAKDTLFKK